MNLDGLIGALFRILPGPLGEWYETPDGRKKVRYALVSVVAVPVGEIGVLVGIVVLGLTAGWANVFGNSMGAIPSYMLNRYWVWGKGGRNHLVKEILPFWVITIVGIVCSLGAGHLAGQVTKDQGITGAGRTVILLGANLAVFGVLWVAKYILFNKVLFVVRHSGTEAPAAPVADR